MINPTQKQIWILIALIIAGMTGYYWGSDSLYPVSVSGPGFISNPISGKQAPVFNYGPKEPLVLASRTKEFDCVAMNSLPDPACTPGAIFPEVTIEKICVSGYTKTVRSVSTSLKKKVYRTYNVAYPPAFGTYEVDHFIPLALGGSNDIANLWPFAAEPRPGFIEKDLVVNYLHRKVCNKEIDLASAQRAITTPWIKVYESIPASEKAELKRLFPSWAETLRK